MRSLYELKHYKNSSDPDFGKALRLYSYYTEPAYRTDSREIIYWADRYNSSFEDAFYIFGFYLNGQLIGFSEVAFFLKEHFIIIDYLLIEEKFRGNNTFYEFSENIKSFLADEKIEYDYIVVQVGNLHQENEPPASQQWIRLLKMSHFKVLKCDYYLPPLGINNFESEMKGILMIYSKNEILSIQKETYFQIVHAIYFKYYQRWYQPFLDDTDSVKYQRNLNKLITIMESKLSSTKSIELNGYHNLFPNGNPPRIEWKKNRVIKLAAIIIAFLVCSVFVAISYVYLRQRFGIEIDALTSIILIAGIFVLFSAALVFENKSNFISRLLEKIIGKL